MVPIWVASEKLEYSAKTLRGKINKKLPDYLIDFPALLIPTRKWPSTDKSIDWDKLIADNLRLEHYYYYYYFAFYGSNLFKLTFSYYQERSRGS